ncbi:hypothetical protein BH10PSE9_BH10PSE9_14110 [soil metagenome]
MLPAAESPIRASTPAIRAACSASLEANPLIGARCSPGAKASSTLSCQRMNRLRASGSNSRTRRTLPWSAGKCVVGDRKCSHVLQYTIDRQTQRLIVDLSVLGQGTANGLTPIAYIHSVDARPARILGALSSHLETGLTVALRIDLRSLTGLERFQPISNALENKTNLVGVASLRVACDQLAADVAVAEKRGNDMRRSAQLAHHRGSGSSQRVTIPPMDPNPCRQFLCPTIPVL